jgi:hypothetical protein
MDGVVGLSAPWALPSTLPMCLLEVHQCFKLLVVFISSRGVLGWAKLQWGKGQQKAGFASGSVRIYSRPSGWEPEACMQCHAP